MHLVFFFFAAMTIFNQTGKKNEDAKGKQRAILDFDATLKPFVCPGSQASETIRSRTHRQINYDEAWDRMH